MASPAHQGIDPSVGAATSRERLRQLPPQLFHPLAARGRAVYLDGLIEIFRKARESHGLLDRAALVDAMDELLGEQGALEDTDELLDHEPQYGVADADPLDVRRRARAGSMIRYFERCGWIRTEMQSDQSARVMLFDHSFRVLDALNQYAAAGSTPLQGIVCSIHDLLAAAATGDQTEVRLAEAARQCEQLLMALRELEHNIGAHMDKLLLEPDVPSVLRRLLHRYGAEVIDSGYHKLKTTDHVSRYRPAIFEALASVGDALKAAMAAEDPGWPDKLHFLRDSFESLDEKIGRIDDRHKLFVDAAVRRVEKLVMGTATVSGIVQSVLQSFVHKHFGSGTAEADETTDNGATELNASSSPQELFLSPHLIELFSLALVDSSSLAKPRKESQPFMPVAEKVKRPSAQKIAKARKETQKQLLRSMGKHRVAQLVDMLLGDATLRRASELPLESAEQIALLIYLRSHGDGSLGYKVRDVQPRLWITRGEIGFYDFFIEQVAAGARAKVGSAQAKSSIGEAEAEFQAEAEASSPWPTEWRI